MKPPSREHMLILLITLASLVLRLHDLGAESLWADEAYAVYMAQLDVGGMLDAVRENDTHPPLHYLILHFWTGLFGDSEHSVRLPAALFGVASVPLIYCLGGCVLNRRVGLMAALFLAVSEFHIRMSQEARGYSLLTMLFLASTLCFLRMMTDPCRRNAAGYLAATALMAYTHPYAVFAVAAQNVHVACGFLVRRTVSGAGRWLMIQASIALLFLPWAIYAHDIPNFIRQISWIDAPTAAMLWRTAANYSGGGGTVWPALWMLLALASLKTAARSGLRNVFDPAAESGRISFLWILLFSSTIAPYAVSVLAAPIYLVKYTVNAAAAYYLLAAAGADALGGRRWWIAAAALAAVALINAQGYYSDVEKPEWREAVGYVKGAMEAGDAIALSDCFQLPVFRYYFGETEGLDVACPGKGAWAEKVGGRRVWAFIHPELKAGENAVDRGLGGGREASEVGDYRHLTVKLYRMRGYNPGKQYLHP